MVAKLRDTVTHMDAANNAIGLSRDRILKQLIDESGLTRVAPTIPGAALCQAQSDTGHSLILGLAVWKLP